MHAAVLFARDVAEGASPGLPIAIAAFLAMFVVFLGMVGLMGKRYKRCPPNRILVIFGKAGPDTPTICLHGGARLIVPLFQDHAWLSLEPIRVEVSRQVSSSGKTIGDPLPRVFSVAIGTTPELMQTAAARLLGLTSDEIKQHAEDLIVAQLDRLLDPIEAGRLQPGDDEYYHRLETSLAAELSQLGLVLINVRRE
jgi:flotillin